MRSLAFSIRASRTVAAAALLLTTAGVCPDKTTTGPSGSSIATVVVTPADSSIAIGASVSLSAKALTAAGAPVPGATFTWLSLDPAIATVSGGGVVTGVAAGAATITASVGGIFGLATVRVQAPVASIVIAPGSAVLQPDATLQLTATLRDANNNVLTGRKVSWTSSDTTAVRVSASGVATGVSFGPTTVTATSEGKSAAIRITTDYSTAPVASLRWEPTSMTMQLFDIEYAKVLTFDAAGRRVSTNVTVTSSNAAVSPATSIMIPAIGTGSAVITATVNGRSANLPLTVQNDPGEVFGNTIAAGSQHTCGITVAGPTYCWGLNGGQIGDGTLTNRFFPTRVSGTATFVTVTAGQNHTCALTGAGAVYCWGDNGFGQLGLPSSTGTASAPTLIPGVPALYRLSAGLNHTCGLAIDGSAYCWGLNSAGQLGDNSLTTRFAPTLVAGGLKFRDISASFATTCAVSRAGAIYCWGDNGSAVYGDGTTTRKLTPSPTLPVVILGKTLVYSRVFLGSGTMCANAVPDTQLYCAGYAASQTEPTTTKTVLTRVTGFGSVGLEVASNSGTSCSWVPSGLVWCWGSTTNDNYGAGTQSGGVAMLQPGFVYSAVTLGLSHGCAIDAFSQLFCWGRGDVGQLGVGAVPFRAAYTAVSGGLNFRASHAFSR